MTDLTPILNELLKGHEAPTTLDPTVTLKKIDGWLDEAYKINSSLVDLHKHLKGIRAPYLRKEGPPRRTHGKKSNNLTDRDREEIDAQTKQLLREFDMRIRVLADAEDVRQKTETHLTRKKYARLGLGALGSWAAGGMGESKSFEQQEEEQQLNALHTHRENVLWYLRQKLQQCGALQAGMMEVRINREMEKNRSILGKSRMAMPQLGGFEHTSAPQKNTSAVHLEVQEKFPDQELTEEQVQLFERENQDMLKHYQSTLDQVRGAEKSLFEIAELQNQLVQNLTTQTEQIDLLVDDSYNTTENVGGGNRELKKATERKSTAKYVFYASCGLSLFLVAWDLII